MFRFNKEQKVFEIAGAKIGGQPGDNPPFLIASMFHNKDKILVDRKGVLRSMFFGSNGVLEGAIEELLNE